MKYRVIATRTTIYEVEADNEEDATDLMINGQAEEVDGNTVRIDAFPLCPTCEGPLDTSTVRFVTYEDDDVREEPTYCSRCDREVAVETA